MKCLGILVVLASMILLFGCVSQPPVSGQNMSSSGTGNVTNATTVTTTGGITNYTTTTGEENVTVTTNIGSDWCIAGQFYDVSGTGAVGDAGTISGKIKGLVNYKGGQYCQIDTTISTAGYSLAYTYYVSPDEKDMWVTTSIGGQTQEIHIDTETGQVITG